MSRQAWVLIPVIASCFCAVGLWGALKIIQITHLERDRHEKDYLHSVAQYLHTNAHFRSRVLGLIMTAGILVTIPTVVIPAPAPATHGWWVFFWINHYLVGTTAVYLSYASLRALRVRRQGMHD